MNKSVSEILVDQLTEEKFDLISQIANATIGIHIEGTKIQYEIYVYYNKYKKRLI